MYQDAIVQGLSMSPDELQEQVDIVVGAGKDSAGRKREPTDPILRTLVKEEGQASKALDRATKESDLCNAVFAPIEGVGPRLAGRFIAAIERIDRFPKPGDLVGYAGMAPTRSTGRLPKRRKGELVSRSPDLNNACWLLQDQMTTYGAKTPFGQMIWQQVERECPCTKEERQIDPELRRRYGSAVRRARIAMTQKFLEHLWNAWRSHRSLATQRAA
jgi:hypothetical protein